MTRLLPLLSFLLLALAVPPANSWQSNVRDTYRKHTTTTTPTRRSSRAKTTVLSASKSNLDGMDLGFVPKKVMSKFLSSIGGPLASSSLQAGYQAGAVTIEELEDVKVNLGELSTELLDDDAIQEKWDQALQNEPWHIQTMGSLASPLVVGLVSRMQTNVQQQAEQMKWINENALPAIQANQTVVNILGGPPIVFNNTRAKYEDDRNVWSASMDVLGPSSGASSSQKKGLVNAYFTPSDDIKILVVEIDDIMHNLTWKGIS